MNEILYSKLQKAVNVAKKALLNPDCASLFGPQPGSGTSMDNGGSQWGVAVGAFLQEMTDSGSIYFTDLSNITTSGNDKAPVAITNVGGGFVIGSTTYWRTQEIAINNINAAGYFWQSSNNTNARTLLHELGHVFDLSKLGSAIQYDANDAKLSQSNTDLIQQKCFPTL
jgi:hypothetical protein